MTIKVTLNNNGGRLALREPFLVSQGTPVAVEFETDYVLSDCFVSFKRGERKATQRVKNLSCIGVPSGFVGAGTLTIEVTAIVNEKPVKRWTVEPIVFREFEAGFYGMPEFENMLAQLCDIAGKTEELLLAVDNLKTRVETLEEVVANVDDIINDPLE